MFAYSRDSLRLQTLQGKQLLPLPIFAVPSISWYRTGFVRHNATSNANNKARVLSARTCDRQGWRWARNKMLTEFMKCILLLKLRVALTVSAKKWKQERCTCKTVYMHSEQASVVLTGRIQRKEIILGTSHVAPLQSLFLLITASTLLISPANLHPRKPLSTPKTKVTEALPHPFRSSVASPPPGGNTSLEAITSPGRGAITQGAYSSWRLMSHTSAALGQYALVRVTQTLWGCHLNDLIRSLYHHAVERPMAKLATDACCLGPRHDAFPEAKCSNRCRSRL